VRGRRVGIGTAAPQEVPEEDRALLVDDERRRSGRELVRSLLRPYTRQVVLASLSVIASTAAVLAMPLFVKMGIDHGVGDRDVGAVIASLIGFLLAAGVDFAGQGLSFRYVGRVAESAIYDLRVRLFTHISSLPLAFFERMKSGRVIARMTSDIDALYELLGQAAVAVVSNLLLLVGIGVTMFILDPVLALVALAVVPLLVLATLVFRKRSTRAYQNVRERVAGVIVTMAEALTGVRVVQAFARERQTRRQFAEVNDAHRRANAETVTLMSLYGPGVELIGQVAVVLVLLVGGYRALGRSDATAYVGTLTAFVLYLRQFFEPLQELSQFYNSWQAATAGAIQVAAVLDTTSTVPSPASPVPLPDGNGEVRFDHVTFGYREAEVLHDVDLLIPGGQTLALVGATGAGKSTIAKLVARFYDPTTGAVTLDGVDLRDVADEELRRAVAVVPQEPFLFTGTVRDNIALGRPEATDEEVEAAAWAVGAHPFVAALPEGYATDVRSRGARLSAGQRQLLSFARAWLVQPRLLILDEATSALDLPSERLVQRALRALLADRTAVVIAHRFSSLEIADRVAVVDGGRIVETGARAELLARPSRFRTMHEAWLASVSAQS
jgi:ABC-type multidrug transport system fused ATPase/permease subunit